MTQNINTYAIQFTSETAAENFVADYGRAYLGTIDPGGDSRYTHVMHIDSEILESDNRIMQYTDAVRGVLDDGDVVTVYEAVETFPYTIG